MSNFPFFLVTPVNNLIRNVEFGAGLKRFGEGSDFSYVPFSLSLAVSTEETTYLTPPCSSSQSLLFTSSLGHIYFNPLIFTIPSFYLISPSLQPSQQ